MKIQHKHNTFLFDVSVGNRIDKVKELLVYTDLPVETIAINLHYACAAEMAADLESQTGLSVDYFLDVKMQKMRTAKKQVSSQAA
jgi:hypothetical protein